MKLSFKNKDDAAISLVILLSIAMLAGGLVYLMTVPKQKAVLARKAAAERVRQEKINNDQRIAASDTYKKARAGLLAQLWNMNSEQVGPVSLNKVTVFATARKLKIQSFRPQRIVTVDGIDRIPFQFTVDGSYANVVQLAQDIEQSGEKLTVDMIQLSDSDGNTDHVSATIQISAYHKADGALNV